MSLRMDASTTLTDAAVFTGGTPGSHVDVGPARSLKSRAIRGSAWTLAGHGLGQLLKLGCSLVVARLLFPEAFGVMAIVYTFMQGLQMFSDIGIGPSIIKDKRGDDPGFVNTAWTIQVFRGAGGALATVLIAWPVAGFYGEPMLTQLLPVAGAVAFISGFNATSLFTLNRHLSLRLYTLFDLGVQLANISATILLAWWTRSVWALVLGDVVGALVRVGCSHWLLPGVRNRFHWDREASRALFRFGRWIFIGTVISFFVSQGDRLILGKLIPIGDLGRYAIAFGLSQAVVRIMRQYSQRVLFPVYARLAEAGPERLRTRTLHLRGALLAAALPPMCVMVVWGDEIIRLLYDARYYGSGEGTLSAGWMLQVLAAGAIASTIGLTISPVLLAVGDSFRHMIAMSLQSAFMIAAMIVGGWYGGTAGLIVGVAVSKFLTYPVNAWFARRYGVWLPILDMAAFGACGLFVVIGRYVSS